MRHYTVTDLWYWEAIENMAVPATQAKQTVELPFASKRLFLSNDGPNPIYIEFDKDNVSVASGFKLSAADGLREIRVQCAKISVICAAGETATLRVGVCR